MKKVFVTMLESLNDLNEEILSKTRTLNLLSISLLKDILSDQNEIIIPEDEVDPEIGFTLYDKYNTVNFYQFTGFKQVDEKIFIYGFCESLGQTYKSSFIEPTPLSYLSTSEVSDIILSLNK